MSSEPIVPNTDESMEAVRRAVAVANARAPKQVDVNDLVADRLMNLQNFFSVIHAIAQQAEGDPTGLFEVTPEIAEEMRTAGAQRAHGVIQKFLESPDGGEEQTVTDIVLRAFVALSVDAVARIAVRDAIAQGIMRAAAEEIGKEPQPESPS